MPFLDNLLCPTQRLILSVNYMRDSSWRLLGAALAVLGIIFLVGGVVAYFGNSRDYVAVLVVFGGIFLVMGAGLAIITLFEKEQVEIAEEKSTLPIES